MKRLAFLALAIFAAAALAQDKPAAPAKEEAKPEPVKEAAAPAPSKAAPRKQRRWNEDARHCLERTSNTEVIKCAEEFL